MRTRTVLSLAALVALTAGGTAAASDVADQSVFSPSLTGQSTFRLARDAPPSRRLPSPTTGLLTCGGDLSFRPSALGRPRDYETRDTPLARALDAFLERSAREISQPRSGWFLLAKTRRDAEVASDIDGTREYGHMAFERRRDGRWDWAGSGGCFPRAFHRGREAVTWWRENDDAPVAPDATRIAVLVQEDHCASGRDASGRVLPPLVHYGRRVVTVTYFIRPLGGAQTCQGVPPTKVVLRLHEPLGGRRLRDGGPHPPAVRP